MIHAICDFCGKDMDRTGNLLTITAFQNFARYHTDTKPYGSEEKAKSFCICSDCIKKHGLPNPYHDYKSISGQKLAYEKSLDTYTDADRQADINARRVEMAEQILPTPDCVAAVNGSGQEKAGNILPAQAGLSDDDLSEFSGQLIDIVEDFMDRIFVKEVHIQGDDYHMLKSKLLETMRNWKLLPPE